MDTRFRIFPEQASTFAERIDRLYLFEVAVAVFFTGLICALILYFGVKYRRRSRAERGNPPTSYLLEVVWSVIPLVLMMGMFAWGAGIYFDLHTIPPGAMQVRVVGKQWMWKIQQPSGKREINTLHVPVDTPVQLRMISDDVIHSFYIPAFRVKQDVLPGRYTNMWFEANRTGTYHLFCAEYCGTEHAQMVGEVVVMSPSDFSTWASDVKTDPPELLGRKLFERHRCDSCHGAQTTTRGPALEGLFGRNVALQGGGNAVADDSYLRESILSPAAKITAGFQPLMPAYQGQLSEDDVNQLIAYIKSLASSSQPTPRADQQ